MTPKIELIKAGHADVTKHREVLANSALGSPTYCDANSGYYQTTSDQRVNKDIDCVAFVEWKAHMEIRLNLADGTKGRILAYLGNTNCSLAMSRAAEKFRFSPISVNVLDDRLRTAIPSPDVNMNISRSSKWSEKLA
jgi:hypothetical protein